MELSEDGEDHSCALENGNDSTVQDISRLSDTLPSISIDENRNPDDYEFYLKQHYEQIDRLRGENFDLKLKLYLLESKEKWTNDSDIKKKVLYEFERKSDELKRSRETIKAQNKEIATLKQRIPGKDLRKENEMLNEKLREAIDICANLVSHTERLIKMNRNNVVEDNRPNLHSILDSSQAYVDRASRFLSDNSIIDQADQNDAAQSNRPQVEAANQKESFRTYIARKATNEKEKSLPPPESVAIDQFMAIVRDLLALIEDFRSNKVSYKIFSSRLDSLFDSLSTQDPELRRNLDQARRNSDTCLRAAEQRMRSFAAYRQKLKTKLCDTSQRIDTIIAKVENDDSL